MDQFLTSNTTLTSSAIPTEGCKKGYLYIRVVRITGGRANSKIGVRFSSNSVFKPAVGVFDSDGEGGCTPNHELALRIFDFQGLSAITVECFQPASLLFNEEPIGQASFLLRDASLVKYSLHSSGVETPLVDHPSAEDSDARGTFAIVYKCY